jgi:hypothetical protein
MELKILILFRYIIQYNSVSECNKDLKFLDNSPEDVNLFAETYVGVANTPYTW